MACQSNELKRRRAVYTKRYLHTPRGRFVTQRKNAKRRNIEWLLTFEQWWNIWQVSGKWAKRGCLQGQYVMGRYGDSGPYSSANVVIQLATENTSIVLRKTSSLPRGVSRNGKRYMAQRHRKGRRRYLGTFTTVRQAYQAYLSA